MGVTDEQIAAAAKRWVDAEDACACDGHGHCRCESRDRLNELYDLTTRAKQADDTMRKAH